MGVKSLWKLLLPIGRRISLETLAGKVLAVDASIWLTQMLKAMRDPETGKMQPGAHLIGFFRRICRLYFHGIKPVFVFDGPTPAIKLREIAERRKRRGGEHMFDTEEEDVKRRAKRLLAGTLQKMKRHKKQQQSTKNNAKKKPPPNSQAEATGGARVGFVEGFYLPGMDDNNKQASDTTNKTNKESVGIGASAVAAISVEEEEEEDQPNRDRHTKSATTEEDEAAILAAIQQDLEEADEHKRKEKDDRQVNDFDAPINVEDDDNVNKVDEVASDGDEEYANDSDDNDNQTSLKRYFNTSRRKKNGTRHKGDCQDVGYISTLPSNERKDAIEEAKRQQRLQSRREYMPAAANPDNFSNVQLDNFLKSSRFNLKVQKMATDQVVQQANSTSKHNKTQPGESVVMASDLTTRISLIREDKNGSSNSKNKNQPNKKRRRGQYDWLNPYHDEPQRPQHPSSAISSARKAAKQDSGSSDEDSEVEWQDADTNTVPLHEEVGDAAAHNKTQSPSDQHNSASAPLLMHVEDDSDDEEEGGFLRTKKTDLSSRASQEKKSGPLSKRKAPPDLCTKPDNAPTTQGSRKIQQKDLIVLNDDSSVESNGSRAKNSGRQQEENDRAYAMALQEMEDTRAAEQLATDHSSQQSTTKFTHDSRKKVVVVDLEDGPANDTDRKPTAKSTELDEEPEDEMDRKPAAKSVSAKPVEEDSSDDEFVDWEEGDGGETSAVVADENSNGMEEVSKDISVSEQGNGNATHNHPTTDVKDNKLAGEAQLRLSSESTEDTPSRGSDLLQSESPKGAIPEDSLGEGEDSFSGWGDGRRSQDTEDVLKRAQATASSLADWAGRAFRRAMKDANRNGDGTQGEAKEDSAVDLTEETEDAPPTDVFDKLVTEPNVVVAEKPQPTSPQTKPIEHTPVPVAARATLRKRQKNESEQEEDTPLQITDDMLKQWESERNQRERDADAVTDEMKAEVIRLLKLFGVPFVEAPAEAESQCVALESLGLVDGIITEDSDVFCFGCKRVYKNVFEEKLYAEAYMADDAEKEMGLNRNSMVALAMLLGSDYTQGVNGVGIVNSMEILKAFEVGSNIKEGLSRFGTWMDGFGEGLKQGKLQEPRNEAELEFEANHKTARNTWKLPANFPNENVMHAYLNPVVDKSTDRFSWGTPDVEGLTVFCAKHIGWPQEETKKMLEPVVARKGQRYTQTRLDSFMHYSDGIKFADVRSKRLRAVLGLDENEEREKSKKKRKPEKSKSSAS